MPTRLYTGPSAAAGQETIVLGATEDLIITRGAQLAPQEAAGVYSVPNSSHRLAIAGDIAAASFGITLTGLANQILISTTGSIISAYSCIAIGGSATSITNNGELTALSGFAVNLTNVISTDAPPPVGGSVAVYNTGTITGGIQSTGNSLKLSNSGLIAATDGPGKNGFVISASDLADTITNTGIIRGNVDLYDGSNTLINRGTVDGFVRLGASSDLVDNRNGFISGAVYLQEGDDFYRPGLHDDNVVGGTGFDTLDFSKSGPVTFALDGSLAATGAAEGDEYGLFEAIIGSNAGGDTLAGNAGDNAIDGRGGNDELMGGEGKDTLTGGNGKDILRGDGGADKLFGDAGNDSLWGGAGADVLTGGASADTFVFDSEAVAPFGQPAVVDTINDLVVADGDRINLSAIDANRGTPANEAFKWIDTASFSKTAGELRYGLNKTGYIVQGDVNGDGVADFSIKLVGFFDNPFALIML